MQLCAAYDEFQEYFKLMGWHTSNLRIRAMCPFCAKEWSCFVYLGVYTLARWTERDVSPNALTYQRYLDRVRETLKSS